MGKEKPAEILRKMTDAVATYKRYGLFWFVGLIFLYVACASAA